MTDLMRLVRIDPTTDCWIWVGAFCRGVPMIWVPSLNSNVSVRREFHERHHGPVKRKRVTFTCDDSRCVSPHHSEAITARELIRRLTKRPGFYGAMWHAKTTTAIRAKSLINMTIARDIRQRNAAGETQTALAAEHGVSQTLVWKIVRNEVWRDVAPSPLAVLVAQQMQTIHPRAPARN